MKRNYVVSSCFSFVSFTFPWHPPPPSWQAGWLNWRRRRRKEGDGCEISRLRGIMSGKFISPFFLFPSKIHLACLLTFPERKARCLFPPLFLSFFTPLDFLSFFPGDVCVYLAAFSPLLSPFPPFPNPPSTASLHNEYALSSSSGLSHSTLQQVVRAHFGGREMESAF